MGLSRAGLTFTLVVSISLALATPMGADDVAELLPQEPVPSAEGGEPQSESSDMWFVELAAPSTSDGNSASAVAASHDAFKGSAKAKGVAYTERFAYGDLWNGFSVRASGTEMASIRQLSDVARVWPVATVALPTSVDTGGDTIDLAAAVAMTGADYVQNTLGFTGKNVKVGIVDTGLDYHNPDLGGCFGPSCRVVAGHDFVGDDFNADTSSLAYNPVAEPGPDPDDCNGHGTHVAGIVGANGAVKGVAPDVRFGAYRVFGCSGATLADIMLAAMERALKDKMHVLNISIGAPFQWPSYPTAIAADRLVTKHGIVVVASTGNNGASGLYSAGSPGLGANVIGVASFDNTFARLPSFTVSGLSAPIGYFAGSPAPPPPTTDSLPLAATGTPTTEGDGCVNAPAPGSLTGKAVLIRRGSPAPGPTCGFYMKAKAAQDAGAAAVVIYNNMPGFISVSVTGTPAITIPVVSVTAADGLAIHNRITAGGATMTWTEGVSSTPVVTSNLISSFSSYGPSPDLSLKPDLGAPGGFIYSTVPLEQGGHGLNSGTSMAAPHVAGAAALLLDARSKYLREQAPGRVRDILQNTAVPQLWWGNPGLGLLDNVQRQGAGMINIRAAIEATAEITPAKLALGESEIENRPATRTLTVRSLPGTGRSITYTFGHQPAVATGPNLATPTFVSAPAAVSFSASSVTLKNNQSATVSVTITPNPSAGLPNRSVYGGYITVQGDDGSTYRVPYVGMKGDLQSAPVLTATRAAARQLGWVVNSQNQVVAQYNTNVNGHGFTMGPAGACTPDPAPGTAPDCFMDVPNYLVHIDFHASRATFTAYDSTGTTALGEAMRFDFLPRNSSLANFFAFDWDGFVGPVGARTMLPNGTYVVKLTVVRALGDPANPAHLENATFVKVNIARP